MGTWGALLAYVGTVLFGIATNFCIAAYYAGKYKERVERLTAEVQGYEKELAVQAKEISRLDSRTKEIVAAITGKLNGNTIREV